MAKVLIIEDDPLILRMYAKIFTFKHHQVLVAGDGEQGITQAIASQPDIILLDVMMPKLNGMDVLDRLKADPRSQNIPVVMLSNLAGEADVETALGKGAIKYIIKSEHDPKDIVDLVDNLLQSHLSAKANK